jgi:hypothetical protein
MNIDSCLSRETAQKIQELPAIQSHAACRRPKSFPGEMDKDGATAPGDAGPRIVVDLDDNVIEAVGAPKTVAWFIGRAPERAVIAAGGRVLAPGIARTDAPERQQCPGPEQAIGPPPNPNRMKPSGGRGAVAFSLGGLNAGAADRDGKDIAACKKPAL